MSANKEIAPVVILTDDQNVPSGHQYDDAPVYVRDGLVVGRRWDPRVAPWRVTITHASSAPGLHGWYKTSEVFTTLDQALAYAACPLRRGQSHVSVDVAKNRGTWTTNGRWEAVGARKNGKAWKWGKGWSQTRVFEVSDWYATNAA